MANKVEVTVSKVSAQPTSNGNFIHTLKTEGNNAVTVFGEEKKANGLTYYIALKGQQKVGAKDTIDLDLFNIVERPFDVTDEQSGEVTTYLLKWLHVK
jgi:hypothetical protein